MCQGVEEVEKYNFSDIFNTKGKGDVEKHLLFKKKTK